MRILIPFTGGSHTELLLSTKHLAMMLKAGVPLFEALEALAEASRGKLAKVFAAVQKKVEQGEQLSRALAVYPDIFPSFYVKLVAIGESSGTLSQNLQEIVTYLAREQELRSRIRGAMMYPVLVLVVFVLVFMAVAMFVLPNLTRVFRVLHGDIPFMTQVVIAIADFFKAYGSIAVPAFGFAMLAFWVLLMQPFIHPVTHRMFLSIPLIGNIARQVSIARFSRNLSLLLSAGISLHEALTIASNAATNVVYQNAIKKVAVPVMQGEGLAAGLLAHPSLFPGFFVRIVSVGERSGKLDEALAFIASFYDQEVEATTQNLTTLLEPLLLVVVAIFVGGFALAVITPIYEITGQLRR